ncbi:MAG TPA: GNVR domain-containing protein [Syntrophobacter fumaroxidans]|nr:GNVR domain-containing protein [Syntrophobacter fumaroxidans]
METGQEKSKEKELTLFDLVLILAKRKRLLLVTTFLFTFLVLIALLMTNPVYKGTAKILIPQSTSSSTILSDLMGGAGASLVGGMLGTSTSANMYLGLLQARTVYDAVIETHKLYELYKNDRLLGRWRDYNMESCREKLFDNFKPQIEPDTNIIDIIVEDADPERCAAMANTFLDELVKLSHNLTLTDAGKRRVFYEGQLKQSFDQLAQAEQALQAFQESTGAIQIDEQARAILGAIATLQAQVSAKEVQIKVMKTYATENNPDLRRASEELAGLQDQLKKLQEQEYAAASSASNPSIPTGIIPTVGANYARKMRDFKYRETLYLMILKMYEQARLDEANDSVVVQVVDRAVVPDRKAKPKMGLMLVAGCVVGFILALFVAFAVEYCERTMRLPGNMPRAADLKRYLTRI